MRKGVRRLEQVEFRGRFKCRHVWIEYVGPYCGRMKEGCPKCGAWRLVEQKKEKSA